jgi:hypothetical protein
MVTAEEIRARVEAADKDRIRARADAAARIAVYVEKRAQVRAQLAEIDAAITAGLADAAAIMTVAELSTFTGISETELNPPPVPPAGGRYGRAPRRKVGARKTRPVVAPPGTAPVTVSSDY